MGAFVGNAIDPETRRIRFLSVSQVQAYDPTEKAGCPRRYWFQKVAKIKEPESEAFAQGKIAARELELYLKNGVDVLGPVARAGKYLLPVPGPDLEVEMDLGDIVAAAKARDVGAPVEIVKQHAGLVACDIPFMGAADCRHRRGEYVDEEGTVRLETVPNVVEVIDHKTTKRVFDHTTAGGYFYKGYSSSADEVARMTQMVGYGVHAAYRFPETEFVRLSHIYYGKEKREAVKRTSLVPVERILKRWARVEGVVREMIDAVQVDDPGKLGVNLLACHAYGRTCHYADKCPRTTDQVLAAEFLKTKDPPPRRDDDEPPATEGKEQTQAQAQPQTQPQPKTEVKEGAKMSVLARISKAPPTTTNAAPPPSAAPTTTPAPDPVAVAAATAKRDAEIAASRMQLLAEDGAAGKKIAVAECDFEQDYIVTGIRMTFKGGSKGFYFFVDAAGKRYSYDASADVRQIVGTETPTASATPTVAASVVPAASDAPAPGIINPPDAPMNGDGAADPLPAAVIAEIKDEEIRQRAEADAAAAEDEKEEKPAATGGGRCPNTARVTLTTDEAMTRKLVCKDCGKTVKIRPAKAADGSYEATIGSHNRPKAGEGEPVKPATETVKPATEPAKIETALVPQAAIMEAAALAPVAQAPAPAIVQPGSIEVSVVPAPAIATVYLDCAVIGSPQPAPLASYYDSIVNSLMEESAKAGHRLLDVRMATEGPLGYGRWRAMLAALVKTRPLPAGDYAAYSHNELDMAVVAALPSVRTVRGVK